MRGKERNMPITNRMTTQTGHSDYARHSRQPDWSQRHKNRRGSGNRK